MKRLHLKVALLSTFLWTLCSVVPSAQADQSSCGSAQTACGEEERCCEHVVASFTNDGVATPPYMEGKCVPKELRCSEFWCGNRHCEKGFFGVPTVCCVNNTPGTLTSYSCAQSELSCPGNTQQVTIRNSSLASGKISAYK